MRDILVLGLLVCTLVPAASAQTQAPTLYTRFGLTVVLPAGWRPIARKLTPCVDPAERLTVVGHGSLVMLQERLRPVAGEFPRRPARFALAGRAHPLECCAPSSRPGWLLRFADNGRGLYAYVYPERVGARADTLAVLASLRVRSRGRGV